MQLFTGQVIHDSDLPSTNHSGSEPAQDSSDSPASAIMSNGGGGGGGINTAAWRITIALLVAVVVVVVFGTVVYMRLKQRRLKNAQVSLELGSNGILIRATPSLPVAGLPETGHRSAVPVRPRPAYGWQGFRSRVDTEVNPYSQGKNVVVVPAAAVGVDERRTAMLYAIPTGDGKLKAPMGTAAMANSTHHTAFDESADRDISEHGQCNNLDTVV